MQWISKNDQYVNNVNEAVKLAHSLQREGKATWFRGQVYPWPPLSSLTRWHNLQVCPDNAEPVFQIETFIDWIQNHPHLGMLRAEQDKVTAIGQHFGIPTHFVDFTTAPDVAGLFSRDRSPDRTYDSDLACIIYFNLQSATDWFHSLTQVEAERLQIYPVKVDLPTLHRLTAQRGVFLHAPDSWHERYPLHRILFKRGPILNEAERLLLYPPTSSLEEEMICFTHAFELLEWRKYLEKRNPGCVIRLNSPPESLMFECFNSGKPEPHRSWPLKTDNWFKPKQLPHSRTSTIQIPRQTQRMGNMMLAECITEQLRDLIVANPTLNADSLNFKLEEAPGALSIRNADAIGKPLSRAWNAMRALPYTLDQRLECFRIIILLGSDDVGYWNPQLSAKLDRMLNGNPENPGRWINLELSSSNGSCISALSSFEQIVETLRPDLESLASEFGNRLLGNDPLEFVRRCRIPDIIFDFAKLADCFVEHIIPTQVLLRDESLPIIFSPADITDFYPSEGKRR